MIPTKEAKKIPFEELDDESQNYYYEQFKKYIVRKQIADTNKELTSLYAKRLKTNNPRNYAYCFNDFNTAFVGANLINFLNYEEIHTDFLKGLSEDNFNAYLKRYGDSFERKIAIICYCTRPSERIANRVSFPVMQAYANMQTLVLQMAYANPKTALTSIFHNAAKTVRDAYKQEQGKEINKSQIAETRTDYKSLGKKTAPIWKNMLEYYKNNLAEIEPEKALKFVFENFVFTQADNSEFLRALDQYQQAEFQHIEEMKQIAETMAEEQPDYYDLADYEEIFSTKSVDEAYAESTNNAINHLFNKYLSDPIFAPKQEKQLNGQIKI